LQRQFLKPCIFIATEFDPQGSNESSICEKFRELIQQFRMIRDKKAVRNALVLKVVSDSTSRALAMDSVNSTFRVWIPEDSAIPSWETSFLKVEIIDLMSFNTIPITTTSSQNLLRKSAPPVLRLTDIYLCFQQIIRQLVKSCV